MADAGSSTAPAHPMEEDLSPRFCYCNLPACFGKDGNLSNPFRRCFVCQNYSNLETRCDYWERIDPEVIDHYKERLRSLKFREKQLLKMITEYPEKYAAELKKKDKKIAPWRGKFVGTMFDDHMRVPG